MSEKPIIFNTARVQAILEGRKTQTRRIVKEISPPNTGGAGFYKPDNVWVWRNGWDGTINGKIGKCPYGKPGDTLWVKESFSLLYACDFFAPEVPDVIPNIWYWADGNPGYGEWAKPKPPLHMRKEESRLTLKITNIRVERLQDISEENAKAEGALYHNGMNVGHSGYRHDINHGFVYGTAKESFEALWESIHGEGSWESNPWVWVIEFERAKGSD